MKRLVQTLPVVVLLVALGAACGGSSSGSSSVSGDDVAVVQGQHITKQQLDQQIALYTASAKASGQTLPKPGSTAYKTQVIQPSLQSLVQNAEVGIIADNLGIKVSDADVQKSIDDVIQKSYGGSKAKFEKDVKKYGYNPQSLNELFRIRLLGNKIESAVTKQVSLSPSELHKKYTDAPEVFGNARNVHYSLWSSKAKAEAALAQLKSGKPESTVTAGAIDADTKHGTTGFTAASGPGLMDTNFQKAAFAQPTGQWGDLVKVDKSYAASSLGGQCKPDCYFLINPIGPVLKAGTPAAEKALHSDIVSKYNASQTVSQAVQAYLLKQVNAIKKDINYADGYAPPAASTAPTTTSSSSTATS